MFGFLLIHGVRFGASRDGCPKVHKKRLGLYQVGDAHVRQGAHALPFFSGETHGLIYGGRAVRDAKHDLRHFVVGDDLVFLFKALDLYLQKKKQKR